MGENLWILWIVSVVTYVILVGMKKWWYVASALHDWITESLIVGDDHKMSAKVLLDHCTRIELPKPYVKVHTLIVINEMVRSRVVK